MFIGYLNTRKELGYECLIDTQCGNRLVLITDWSVVFVKNVTLDGKRKIFVIIVGKMIFAHHSIYLLIFFEIPTTICCASLMNYLILRR